MLNLGIGDELLGWVAFGGFAWTFAIPGILLGIVVYAALLVINAAIILLSAFKLWIKARVLLVLHCLLCVAMTVFLAITEGGGNSATNQVLGTYLLMGCVLNALSVLMDDFLLRVARARSQDKQEGAAA
ncbi:hypothetical protein [Corynebacterium lizhenjunii]|uniref:hypothetical protein n=1 Tax=Corynebacterium lizhenjunii TaxID=2709394 RepID=UPI0013ECA88C|nr:hypothetical protein [Corynebacterium lizhenjunii]